MDKKVITHKSFKDGKVFLKKFKLRIFQINIYEFSSYIINTYISVIQIFKIEKVKK